MDLVDRLPFEPMAVLATKSIFRAVLIFPDITHESGRVCGARTVSPAAKEPKVAVRIAPADSAPPRTWYISRHSSEQVVVACAP